MGGGQEFFFFFPPNRAASTCRVLLAAAEVSEPRHLSYKRTVSALSEGLETYFINRCSVLKQEAAFSSQDHVSDPPLTVFLEKMHLFFCQATDKKVDTAPFSSTLHCGNVLAELSRSSQEAIICF